jgi:transcriptional antiterminator Rof (Rho-off)
MMRDSVAPTRSSHASSAAAQAKFVEKKKEYEAVTALDKLTSLMADRMEGLSEDTELMAKAGEGLHLLPYYSY